MAKLLTLFVLLLFTSFCSKEEKKSEDFKSFEDTFSDALDQEKEVSDAAGVDFTDTEKNDASESEVDTGSKITHEWLPLPEGYGEFCMSDDDCKEWGLSCFKKNDEDLYAQCSKECEYNKDCPEPLLCLKKGDKKICQVGNYCSECIKDANCGYPNICVKDDTGHKFCSEPCDPAGNSCKAGSMCRKTESGYYCFPIYGSCKGDGGLCSPCGEDNLCKQGYVCLTSYYTKESFCTKYCQKQADCGEGFACAQIQDGYVCLRSYQGQILPTCYTQYQDMCGSCIADYQCKKGLYCYHSFDGGGNFCSKPCNSNDECKEGWYCKPSYNSDKIPTIKLCAPLETEKCIP